MRRIYLHLALDKVNDLSFFSVHKDVDVELRIVCEQFIQSVSESLIAPLSAFLAKVSFNYKTT